MLNIFLDNAAPTVAINADKEFVQKNGNIASVAYNILLPPLTTSPSRVNTRKNRRQRRFLAHIKETSLSRQTANI